MKKRRLFVGVAVVAAMSLVLAACGDGEEAKPAAPSPASSLNLKIGVTAPFTGDLSPFGKPDFEGGKLAVGVIEEAVKALGLDYKVELFAEDSQTKPDAAVEAARKLIDTQSVTVIIGGWASAETIPIAESVTVPRQILQISPASTAAAITNLKDNGFVFRTAISDVLQAKLAAETMGGVFGKDATLNVGGRNDAYGSGLVDAFAQEWKDRGGTVGAVVKWDPTQATFDSEAQKLVAGSPDAWFLVDFPETWAKVGPALARTGDWDVKKTFSTDGLKDTTLPKKAGKGVTEGMRGTAPGSAVPPSKAGPAFDALWKEKLTIERQTFDSTVFDAVMLAFLAAVKAGSTAGADLKEALPDVAGPAGTIYSFLDLKQAIEDLRAGKDIDYDGASGPVNFDDAGDPIPVKGQSYDLWEFKGGKLVVNSQVDATEIK